MSTLLSCHDLEKSAGSRTLFSGLELHIHPGDRIGLIGANGSGKSTLLAILAGLEPPDRGERMCRRDLRIALVEQQPKLPTEGTVEEVLLAALPAGLDEVAARLRVASTLSQTGFADPAQPVAHLSGGTVRRLTIARALAVEPELLLLDEPTNHLDLETILWLEELLKAAPFAFMVVTHDRAFLQRVTNRTLELDPRFRGGLLSVDGDYGVFLERRADLLAARAEREVSLANKVRREVEWLRRGPKARSTKAYGRIKAAQELIAELGQMRSERPGQAASIDFSATGRKSKRLLLAQGLGHAVLDQDGLARPLFAGLDLLLRPGTCLGLVGPNGAGKSTLLGILAGERAPDRGELNRADGLRVVRFDQSRTGLDPALSLRENLADRDLVHYRGEALHVVGWAARFGFRAEQLEVALERLSGGEQAKVAIARLMLSEADVLLLDEPTNDLDIQTLEVLEDSLADFPGAIVLVSHDRSLLDHLADLIVYLDGQGGVELLADTDQWEQAVRLAAKPRRKPEAPRPRRDRPRPRGLSYLEKREFEGMEAAILEAEERLGAARLALEEKAVQSDAAALAERYAALQAAEAEVSRLYDRWSELEQKRQGQ